MELNLSNGSLQTLPTLHGQRYTTLNASYNKLRVLWADDFPLGVEDVNLQHNSINEDGLLSDWPDTIRVLNLSDNPLYSLSVLTSWPRSLRSLNLSYTNIQDIRSTILPASLESLTVSCTAIREIQTLPAGLKELYASNTNIHTLPRSLPAGLERMEVNCTSLKNGGLPRSWGTALKELSLADNFLEEIPGGLPPTVEIVNLTGNRIQRICSREKFPRSLQLILLGRNAILEIPPWLQEISAKFTIQFNKLTERIHSPNCLLSHTQWNTPNHTIAVKQIQGAWRRCRLKQRVRTFARMWRTKEDLLALAMNPDRAGRFEQIENCWRRRA